MAESTSPIAWTLHAIARLEREGFKQPRLTDPGFALWARVRRRLGWVAFIDLLHEDLAEAFPTCFALDQWNEHPTSHLDEPTAEALVHAAARPDGSERLAFLKRACGGLGLMDGGNIASLPKVQPHQRALELAGVGGRIAAYQIENHSGLALHDQFVFVADTDAERVAIGLAATEFRANAPTVLTSAQLRQSLPRFDHIFGIRGYPAAERLAKELNLEVRWA